MEYINIERTEKEFNYKIKDLSPCSAKLVYRICEICKKEELRQFGRVSKYKCTKCRNCSNKIKSNSSKEARSKSLKETWKKNGHPRQGIPHTEESRKKMSESLKANPRTYSEETRKKMSEKGKGEKNHFYGKKHTPEAREKMSETRRRIAKRGKDSPLYGRVLHTKHIKYTTKDGTIIKMRSSWEIKTAQYLDKNNINWIYEKMAFPVIYEFEGKQREGCYIPDFFLENGEIWEVKGYWRKDALEKFEAFKKYFPNEKIVLLQKKELKELGIL